LPVWGAIYSLLIFPVLWALMEQCTYQGYALPRLETSLKSTGLALAIVVFGWGIQHIALPLTFDLRFMLYRFLSFLPLAVVMTLVYLRTRRLIPFIVAHWAVDMIGVLTGIILPMVVK
jgi:membrane protease YdiL (CAAX protease family)